MVNRPVGKLVAAKRNSLKTVGTKTAPLLSALYDRAQTTFTLADVVEITGLRHALASSLLHKAGKRGLVSRLKRGVWVSEATLRSDAAAHDPGGSIVFGLL